MKSAVIYLLFLVIFVGCTGESVIDANLEDVISSMNLNTESVIELSEDDGIKVSAFDEEGKPAPIIFNETRVIINSQNDAVALCRFFDFTRPNEVEYSSVRGDQFAKVSGSSYHKLYFPIPMTKIVPSQNSYMFPYLAEYTLSIDELIPAVYSAGGLYYPRRDYLTSFTCKGTTTDHIGLGTNSSINKDFFKAVLEKNGAAEIGKNHPVLAQIYPSTKYFMVADAETYWKPSKWWNTSQSFRSCSSNLLPEKGFSEVSRTAAKRICSDLNYFGLLFHSTKMVYESREMGQINKFDSTFNQWAEVSADHETQVFFECEGDKGGGTDLDIALPALFLDKVVCY